jgi:hypothetical protein
MEVGRWKMEKRIRAKLILLCEMKESSKEGVIAISQIYIWRASDKRREIGGVSLMDREPQQK